MIITKELTYEDIVHGIGSDWYKGASVDETEEKPVEGAHAPHVQQSLVYIHDYLIQNHEINDANSSSPCALLGFSLQTGAVLCKPIYTLE